MCAREMSGPISVSSSIPLPTTIFWHASAKRGRKSAAILRSSSKRDPALHTSPYLCLFSLCIAMAGSLSAFNVLWAIPGTLLTGTAAAAGIALMTTVGNLGGYASPFMMGWIKQATGHLEFGLYALAALTLVAALVMSSVRPRDQQAQAIAVPG